MGHGVIIRLPHENISARTTRLISLVQLGVVGACPHAHFKITEVVARVRGDSRWGEDQATIRKHLGL